MSLLNPFSEQQMDNFSVILENVKNLTGKVNIDNVNDTITNIKDITKNSSTEIKEHGKSLIYGFLTYKLLILLILLGILIYLIKISKRK